MLILSGNLTHNSLTKFLYVDPERGGREPYTHAGFICLWSGSIDPASIGDPVSGAEIFKSGTETTSFHCSGCNSLDGNELECGLSGPSISGIADTAVTHTALSAVEYLNESILDPGEFIVDGYQNNVGSGFQYLLSEEEIDALVAFMLTQQPSQNTLEGTRRAEHSPTLSGKQSKSM